MQNAIFFALALLACGTRCTPRTSRRFPFIVRKGTRAPNMTVVAAMVEEYFRNRSTNNVPTPSEADLVALGLSGNQAENHTNTFLSSTGNVVQTIQAAHNMNPPTQNRGSGVVSTKPTEAATCRYSCRVCSLRCPVAPKVRGPKPSGNRCGNNARRP